MGGIGDGMLRILISLGHGTEGNFMFSLRWRVVSFLGQNIGSGRGRRFLRPSANYKHGTNSLLINFPAIFVVHSTFH